MAGPALKGRQGRPWFYFFTGLFLLDCHSTVYRTRRKGVVSAEGMVVRATAPTRVIPGRLRVQCSISPRAHVYEKHDVAPPPTTPHTARVLGWPPLSKRVSAGTEWAKPVNEFDYMRFHYSKLHVYRCHTQSARVYTNAGKLCTHDVSCIHIYI